MDLRWLPTERTEVSLSTSWARTEAAYDSLSVFPAGDVPMQLFPNGLPGAGPDPNAPVAFADYDLSEVHETSDLEYTELRTSLGLKYRVRSNLSLYGALSYFDLKDDAPYLQDATGDVTLVTTGLSWQSN